MVRILPQARRLVGQRLFSTLICLSLGSVVPLPVSLSAWRLSVCRGGHRRTEAFPWFWDPVNWRRVAVCWPLPLFWSGSTDPVLGHVAAVYNYLWGINTWLAHSPSNTFGWNLGAGRAFSPTPPHSRAGRLENLIFCNRAASIIFWWVMWYLVKLLKLISEPTFLAFHHQSLHVHWWRGWGNIIIFVLYIFLALFSNLVQKLCCPDLLASSQPSIHVPRVLLGVFGICIVYLALACGLIHFFLSSAVTTGSEVQRFYFQARLLVILVTLKPHNEKLTFQNKDTCLNFYSSFSTT